jgi:hypothetical protein
MGMRVCHQCKCEMIEGFDVAVEARYGIKITKGKGIFSEWMEKPKAAICPKCGEVSLYIENIEELSEKK